MMKKVITLIFISVLIPAFYYSCYYDNVQDLYPGSVQCDSIQVDFINTIKPMVEVNCAIPGCHTVGAGQVNLTTYQGIKTIADNGKLEERVITRKDMPPTQPLSYCDIQYLKSWLQSGAPKI